MCRRAGWRMLALTVASVAVFVTLAVTGAAPAFAGEPDPQMKCPLLVRSSLDICR